MMDDLNFDRMLEEAVAELPPDARQTKAVTPWRQAMTWIVWGVGLGAIQLDFWYLDYILPALGVVLSWLGYRALRRENRYFKLGWLVSCYMLAEQFVLLTLNATIFRLGELPLANGLLTGFSLTMGWVRQLALWKGIRAVRCKAGQPDSAGAVVALMVWEAVLVVAALLGAEGWLVLLPMLVACAAILYYLSKIPALLDEAGYEVKAAPVRLSDPAAGTLYAFALVISICVAGVLFCRYPMDWQPVDPEEHAGQEEIISHLTGLGMPEEMAAELSATDLEDVKDAVYVYVSEDYHSFTQSRMDAKVIKFTYAAARLPGGRMKIIHRFEWLVEPPIRTTECITLWPADQYEEGYRIDGEVTGRLLCDLAGGTYAADFYEIQEETHTYEGPLGLNGGTRTDIFLNFSFPGNGECLRGCFSYTVEVLDESWVLSSWANYRHQTSAVNYPMMTAEEYDRTGARSFGGLFDRAQTTLQFWPSEYGG